MTRLDPIEMDRAARFMHDLCTTSAQVNMYIETTRIYQPGLDYAPLALQYPALDDAVANIPEELRH